MQLPQQGILGLQNGHVIEGVIVVAGDRYRVSVGGRDEVFLPADSVRFRCRTLDEAYVRMSRELRPTDLNGRVTLVQWCLQNLILLCKRA